ncbi:epoxyqueuosine reductase [Phycisphaerae bacterium]|nr:epoxyqueuosine reductase [Phycisphaerae bacterium]
MPRRKRTGPKQPRKPATIAVPSGYVPPSPDEAARDILARCKQLDFALAGIAPAQPSAHGDHLRAWLAAGKHGSMRFMTDDIETRIDPTRILANTRAFIVVADLYATRNDAPDAIPPNHGKIARYARGRNYHDVVKRRLHTLADQLRIAYPGSEFRTCVDTAPVNERELATLAGLGWQGKHTLVINPAIGSYFVLGVVATTLELARSERVPDSCGTCTRCIDACPTRAISPYSVDASRCISYLTIERELPIDRDLQRAMGSWIFGCDVCQEVCPHNSPRPFDVGAANGAYTPQHASFDLLKVLGWSEEDRREAFTNSAMKRASLAQMQRNAAISAGNANDPALRQRLAALALDPSAPELLRQTARAVMQAPAADAR